MEICTDLVYGSIEFDLVFGKVERLNYCKSFNGEILKKKFGENSVDVVTGGAPCESFSKRN